MTEDDSHYEKEEVIEDDSDTTTNESKNDDVVSAADTLLSILDHGADNQSHIEFKTPIPRNDPDYKYVSNFYRKKTTHSRRDSASQSPHVGKSPRNPIKRSKHLPPDVKDFDSPQPKVVDQQGPRQTKRGPLKMHYVANV